MEFYYGFRIAACIFTPLGIKGSRFEQHSNSSITGEVRMGVPELRVHAAPHRSPSRHAPLCRARGVSPFIHCFPNRRCFSTLPSLALSEPQVTHTEHRMPTHDVASRIEYSEKYQDDTHEYR